MPYADRERALASMRRRYADRKEEYRAYNQLHRAQRIALARKTNLKNLYGITPEIYDELLAAQGGVCAICRGGLNGKSKKYFSVDHDHATGRVRGLLCEACNFGLGKFRDSSDLLQKAAQYLARNAH